MIQASDALPASYIREVPKMAKETKAMPPDGFVDSEPTEEVVNDSLGTVDPADTADTDPKDDPAAHGESARRKEG